jgi:phenylacetic acid degradation operon negative regulatory protein
MVVKTRTDISKIITIIEINDIFIKGLCQGRGIRLLSIEKQMLFLLSHIENMKIQELIRIYESRGYASISIRNSLSRLKKEGYVTAPSRSVYRITDAGRGFIRSINGKPRHYDESWDGKWVVVMIGVSEEERKKRDRFRTEMLQFGFGLLYNGVYISPWDHREDISGCVEKLGLTDKVTFFHGAADPGHITPEKSRAIWQLDKVAQLYQQKWMWYEGEFKKAMRTTVNGDREPLELFLLYLQLGEAVSDLFLVDPMLPKELLPDDWTAKHKLKHMLDDHALLARLIPENSIYARFT